MAHSFIELLKVVILMLRKIEGRRRGRQRITWLDGFSDSMNTSLSNSRRQEGQGSGCIAGHGVTKSWTQLSSRTTRVWANLS